MMCFDINNIIFYLLSFRSKHEFKKINKSSTKLKIIDLLNIEIKYLRKLDDKILKNYPQTIKLYASNNKLITKINKMKNLRVLYAEESCGLSHFGFSCCINIKVLHATDNKKIKNINFLTNLTELSARSTFSGIVHDSFKDCTNLEILDIRHNANILTLKGFTNLKYLDASYCRRLSDKYINDCTKLEMLYLDGVETFNDLNKLSNLRTLRAASTINTDGLIGCVNLEILDFCYNLNSINFNHLTNLKMLRKQYVCDDNIKYCTSLEVLFTFPCCSDLNNLTNLRMLCASGENLVTNSIINCTNLEVLNVYYCNNLENIDHLENLKILRITGPNKLEIHEIEKKCTNLKRITNSDYNTINLNFNVLWNDNIVDDFIRNYQSY